MKIVMIFDWKNKTTGEQDGISDHVGIVKSYDFESRTIHTIEGNSGDECRERTYNKDDVQILGFGSNRIQSIQEIDSSIT